MAHKCHFTHKLTLLQANDIMLPVSVRRHSVQKKEFIPASQNRIAVRKAIACFAVATIILLITSSCNLLYLIESQKNEESDIELSFTGDSLWEYSIPSLDYTLFDDVGIGSARFTITDANSESRDFSLAIPGPSNVYVLRNTYDISELVYPGENTFTCTITDRLGKVTTIVNDEKLYMYGQPMCMTSDPLATGHQDTVSIWSVYGIESVTYELFDGSQASLSGPHNLVDTATGAVAAGQRSITGILTEAVSTINTAYFTITVTDGSGNTTTFPSQNQFPF